VDRITRPIALEYKYARPLRVVRILLNDHGVLHTHHHATRGESIFGELVVAVLGDPGFPLAHELAHMIEDLAHSSIVLGRGSRGNRP
jgi:hypothetical protein